MKNYLLLISAFIFSTIKCDAQWTLVWSDDFNGTSINGYNWTFETGGSGWGNSELENYTNRPVNATVSKGNLLIIAKKESYGGNSYTSARMNTLGQHSWTYGKVEARMKVPIGKGLWPAFWMLGDNISTIGWPKCGEIDIMEHINTENLIYGTMHWDNNGHASYGGNTTFDGTKYHIYSIEWDANAIKWYLDGTKYWEGNIANNINSTDEFHLPLYIVLNLAVGGTWPGSPDVTTTFPDTMFVDYVNVYQQLATNVKSNAVQDNSIKIFPNPANDNITLSFENPGNVEYKIEVTDLLGKVCMQRTVSAINNGNNSVAVSLNDLNPGVYLLNMRDDKRSSFLKFVKQ